jgi:Holliday junction resolvase RusA-like endonuclease
MIIDINYNPRPASRPRVTRYGTYSKDTPHQKEFNSMYELPEGFVPFTEPVHVEMIFIIPVPKSYSKKKKAELIGKYHTQKPDIDNLAKFAMDAISTKGVWSDDSIVACTSIKKIWGNVGRVYINISILENIIK